VSAAIDPTAFINMSWVIIGFVLLAVAIKVITSFGVPPSPTSLERVEEAYHAEMDRRFANLMQQLAPSLKGLPFAEGSEKKFAEMVFIAKGFVLVTESDRAAALAICESGGSSRIETNADDEDPNICRISLVGGSGGGEARRVCELYRYTDVGNGNISEGHTKMLGMMLRRFCNEDGTWIIALIPNKEAEVYTICLDGGEIQYGIFADVPA